MSLTPLPAPPSRNDPSNFAERGDAFMSALPTLVTELSALQEDVTTKQGTASSAATTATNAAAAAEVHKNASAGSATSAAGSATSAAGSANTATTKAGEALASAILAGEHAASIDPATIVRKSGNQTVSDVITFTSSPVVPVDFAWHTKPIGEVFFLLDDLSGSLTPPVDNANYRYVKLSASEPYNTGILTSESVTGSAPLVVATAVINLAGSPINGKTVNLINTERRVIRAGSSGTLEQDAMQGHYHRELVGPNSTNAASGLVGTAYRSGYDGSAQALCHNSSNQFNDNAIRTAITDGTNGTPRTANETRVKSIGATAYMRIK